MDVGVRIFAEHVGMRLQRIVNFHFGRGAIAREGVKIAGGVAQRNREIVDVIERARERLARRPALP